MTGLFVIFAGLLLVVAGAAWLVGPWVLVGAGVVVVLVGLFVDFDRVKEPQRAKRRSTAP